MVARLWSRILAGFCLKRRFAMLEHLHALSKASRLTPQEKVTELRFDSLYWTACSNNSSKVYFHLFDRRLRAGLQLLIHLSRACCQGDELVEFAQHQMYSFVECGKSNTDRTPWCTQRDSCTQTITLLSNCPFCSRC